MAVTILGPALILLILTVAAFPFAAAIYYLMDSLRKHAGLKAAVAVLCFEAAAFYVFLNWRATSFEEGLQSGAIDGPVGFGGGIIEGFVTMTSAILLTLNTLGLLYIWRKSARSRHSD